MDENETNAPLADAPQQQADADARVSSEQPIDPQGPAPEGKIFTESSREATKDVPVAPAAQAFAARIAAAKFEHREQGHDETMKLLDEMFAAIERLEARS